MKSSKIVIAVLDLLAAGKLDAAVEYIADDFVCHEAASLPYAGDYRGKEGFLKLFALLGTTWKEFGFKIHDVIGEGDTCAVIETIWGKIAGKPWEMPVVELWRIRDGKVIEATPYYHDAGLMGKLHRSQS
jgi:ketosteroid isomerase-like protein